LPDIIETLIEKRDQLGLSFGIEPVYLGLEFGDDVKSKALNAQVKAAAQQSFMRLFHCKLEELDLTFRIVVLFLFAYLTRVVIGLTKSKPRKLAIVKPFIAIMAVDSVVFEEEPPPAGQPDRPPQPPPGRAMAGTRTVTLTDNTRAAMLRNATRESVDLGSLAGGAAREVAASRMNIGSVDARILGGSPLLVTALTDFASLSHNARFAEDRARSSTLLAELRAGDNTGTLTDRLVDTSEEDSMGNLFKTIRGSDDNRELFDIIKDLVIDRGIGNDNDEAAANIYPSILLLDKTEALISELNAERIADFEFDRFDRAYVTFVDAYDKYIQHVDKIDNRADRELAEAQSEVIAAYGPIASIGVRTGISSIVEEFEARAKKTYLESLFENFARRHPGLEHQSGVPKGGTLVLAYVHKSLLGQTLGDQLPALEELFEPVFRVGNAPGELTDPKTLFEPQPAQSDPLKEFVVVADFALPYRCCDSECEILEFKPPVVRIPPPKVISGTIRGIRLNQIDPTVLKNARVKVINENTGDVVPDIQFKDGVFAFNADPGTYSIEVKNNGFETSTRLLSVTEGGEHAENFELTRK